MRRLAVSEIIERDPEVVFAFLADLANAPRWLPGVRSVEILTPSMPGRSERGQAWRMVRDIGSREAALNVEVLEHRGPGMVAPPYRFAFGATVAGLDLVWRYRVQSAGTGRSRVEMLMESGHGGLLARLARPVVMRALHSADASQLQSLKDALEA